MVDSYQVVQEKENITPADIFACYLSSESKCYGIRDVSPFTVTFRKQPIHLPAIAISWSQVPSGSWYFFFSRPTANYLFLHCVMLKTRCVWETGNKPACRSCWKNALNRLGAFSYLFRISLRPSNLTSIVKHAFFFAF